MATLKTVKSPTPSAIKRMEEEEDDIQKPPQKDTLPSNVELCFRGFVLHWRFFFTLLWPCICALVFVVGQTAAWKCAWLTLVMSGYWVTRALPLGITGVLPVALFPILGILDSKTTCMQYFSPANFIFMGALIVAFAIEATNLHERLALFMIICIGTTHLRLTLGFMTVTLLISMWIVNTAATAMMVPVAMAVLKQLEEANLAEVFTSKGSIEEEPQPSRTLMCYLFIIAWASTIGGIGTLVGTASNITFKGIIETQFPKMPPIDFADWVIVMTPMSLIMGFLVWLVLCWQYLGLLRNSGMDPLLMEQKTEGIEKKLRAARIARETVTYKLEEMGRMSWGEWCVTAIFVLAIALWVTRDPSWLRGWAPTFTSLKVSDATPTMFVCILFFVVPATLGVCHCMNKDPAKRPTKPIEGILTWNIVRLKMMWGFILLLGGGFALAKGFEASGLSVMIGEALKGLSVLPPFAVLCIVCFVCTAFTELTSNVAVANILLPVLAQLAVVVKINPIYLMLPAALCCSFAFMLPVGTPPNAVITGYGHIRTKDMVVAGIAPNIITFVVTVALWTTLGSAVYKLGEGFPDWAKNENS